MKAYAYTPAGTALSGTPIKTEAFAYGNTSNPDRLTSYKGNAITYNANGGVATYNGCDYTWSKGRLSTIHRTLGDSSRALILPSLSSYQKYSYSYNGLGQRVSSSYNYVNNGNAQVEFGELMSYNKKFSYDHGGRLIYETKTQTYYGEGSESYEIVYLYDDTGVVGMAYTQNNVTSTYYFQKNLMGDVIAIYDTNGAKVAGYTYDAWGNCTITSDTTNYTAAHANPFRYRSYYYDSDTNLYYLNARYYSPEWRRFISPDDTAYLDPKNVNGCNLYCYCANNPVMFVDPSGEDAILLTIFDWPRGLPIFGHTVLLIEVDGVWYSTEFVSGAKYDIEWLANLGIPSSINPKIYTSDPINKDKFLSGLKSYMMTEFKGDFRPSYEFAKTHNGTAYNEGYRLFTNNCAHYVADVLLQSLDIVGHIRNYYEKKPIVPILMHTTTNFIQSYPYVLDALASWWNSFTSFFKGEK